jgi:hypothetical protein
VDLSGYLNATSLQLCKKKKKKKKEEKKEEERPSHCIIKFPLKVHKYARRKIVTERVCLRYERNLS